MDLVLPNDEFHRLLNRERAGSDRNEHQFSLIVFDGIAGKGAAARELVRTIARRVRQIDEIGWFDARSIGLILPYTSSEGARVLAEEICGRLGRPTSACTIYTYPERWLNGDDNEPRRGSRETVFPHPTPVWKRALDVLGALFALVCLSLLMLVIALLIKVVSPGQALLRQTRLGQHGKPFMIWKFRTMRPNADSGLHANHVSALIAQDTPMTKLDVKRDPRVFPLGRVMRRLCLDELPQLINVLRGEMSLVGPRPCLPYEAAVYRLWQTARFDAVPGLTGLWQVSGKNKRTFKEMMRLDITYARKATFWLDAWIILKTLPVIIADTAVTALSGAGRKQL